MYNFIGNIQLHQVITFRIFHDCIKLNFLKVPDTETDQELHLFLQLFDNQCRLTFAPPQSDLNQAHE